MVVDVGAVGVRAHPRSRGDHLHSLPGACGFGGSSPLARGPLPGFGACAGRDGLIPARAGTTGAMAGMGGAMGLIPARAGTTRELQRLCAGARAHPRSRGDHSRIPRSTSRMPGSSPLARGPPIMNHPVEPATGLIPARAGTTHATAYLILPRWAHPRSRGDHTI